MRSKVKQSLVGIHDLVCSFLDGERVLDLDAAVDCFRQTEMLTSVVLATNNPRNCDVGTASEQTERFDEFCRKHFDRDIGEEEFRHSCDRCPIAKARIKEGCGSSQKGCVFIWEQMTYDEGADNEQG